MTQRQPSSAVLNDSPSPEPIPANVELVANSILTDSFPVGVYQTDADGNAVYVNKRWYEISGQEPGTALGHGFITVLHPDDLPGVLDACRCAAAECRDYSIEYRIIRPTGEMRWVNSKGGALRGPDGKCAGHVGIILDITDRKNAQQALADAHQLNNQIIASVRDGLHVVDREHRYRVWNPMMEHITGRKADEVIGKRAEEAFPYLRDLGVLDAMEKAMRGESVSLDVPDKDAPTGQIAWRSSLKSPLRSSTGEIIGVITTLRDITERRRSQQSLLLFRALMDGITDGIEIFEFQTGRLLDVNEKSTLDHGYTREEMLALSVFDIDPLITPQSYSKNFGELTTHGNIVLETIHRRKNGSTFPVEVNLRLVQLDRQYLVAIVRDITERKKAQETTILAEKMLSVGGLAAGISHEINNQLAAMMQCAEIVLNRINPSWPPNQSTAVLHGITIQAINAYMEDREIITMLKAIHKSGERAARIVKNMLQFTRSGIASKETIRLDSLIDQTLELIYNDPDLKKRFDSNHAQIIRQYVSPNDVVRCSPTEVQQVFFNLFKNSIQAAASEINRTEPLRIVVGTRRDEQHITVEISDNGPGMPENIRRHVFEPFFSTKEPGEGSGLGLFISYFIITQYHGGTMSVESTPGLGTSFRIGFPT